jgi:L-asparaginase
LASDIRTDTARVAVVATGGTIASLYDGELEGVAAALSVQDLVRSAGKHASAFVGPVIDLARVNSWNVDPRLMWDVAATVNQLAARDDVSGVVVTHGTDTLEETAFVTDVLVDTEKPVVFTAAMRAADDVSPDGPNNLRSALQAAASPALHGLGALVCLDGVLQAARWARKWHTQSTAAFSTGMAPVATLDPDGEVQRACGALLRWTVPNGSSGAQPRADDVPILQAYTGMSTGAARGLVDATSPRGLVVEGFGLGHVPTALRAALADLVAAGVVVAVSTRVPHGGTGAVYGGVGGGTDLVDLGVVAAGALSAGKTRLLLLACLADRDQTSARHLFREGVAVLGRVAEGHAQ